MRISDWSSDVCSSDLRGYIGKAAGFSLGGLAGVKIVGDYVDNYKKGLPSEMALLNLFDPETGMPVALLDATAITEMRTGAVTALGPKYLPSQASRVIEHIGPRGTDRKSGLSWRRGAGREDLSMRRVINTKQNTAY